MKILVNDVMKILHYQLKAYTETILKKSKNAQSYFL